MIAEHVSVAKYEVETVFALCSSGIENWCSLQFEVHLQVRFFKYQNADLNLTANPWAMALYTKWQFVPPLFLHVCMDHIGQHSTMSYQIFLESNHSIHT